MTRIARFRYRGQDRLGIVDGDDYLDATAACAAALAAEGSLVADQRAHGILPPDMLAYLQGGAESAAALVRAAGFARGLDRAQALERGIRVPRADTETLVPVPNPPKILCVARNFGKHAKEAGLEISQIPILFARFAATQVADGAPVVVPTVSDQVDWEGELGVIIGTGGRHIDPADAFDHVAGYTIFNDVSVRDYQFRVTQYTEGKNFYASAPVGPVVALADEGLNPHDVRITTTVNGVVKQDASTDEFLFDVPTMIHHISEFIPLEPGDIIAMGTPAGVGFKRTPPEFLAAGDVVEVAIEGIGVLRNPVVDEEDAS